MSKISLGCPGEYGLSHMVKGRNYGSCYVSTGVEIAHLIGYL